MVADAEVIVIGGGVVGLAIARALLLRGKDVLSLERHERIGTETSSRNSEVIHAGLYYPPGSLRAQLCVTGRDLLYRFADENGVCVRRCGKLLVATSEAELPRLHSIAQTAARNGVGDLQWLSAAQARALEPEVSCVAACLSPSTGVIDSYGLMNALEGHVTTLGGAIVLRTAAQGLSLSHDGTFEIETVGSGGNSTITARQVVVAAGLGATELTRTLDFKSTYEPPATYPAKGHYFSLQQRNPFRHLIYPMPQGAWLGVHFTLDFAGRAKFGPDIEWKDSVNYDFEDADAARRGMFEREIRRYWPGLLDDALQPDYTGVRPKIYKAGEQPADFRIDGPELHGVPGLIALFGIESPGLTASLAIAERVAGRLAD
jgi:L-2-hydroxyglutarate oxidase LhgO